MVFLEHTKLNISTPVTNTRYALGRNQHWTPQLLNITGYTIYEMTQTVKTLEHYDSIIRDHKQFKSVYN